VSIEFDLGQIGSIHDVNAGSKSDPVTIRTNAAAQAWALSKAGIGNGDLVIITHGGTPTFFSDLFAVWSLGACAVCINPGLAPGELRNVVDFTDAKALILGEGDDRVDLPDGLVHLSPIRDAGDIAPIAKIEADKDAPALILFTSGTTGQPKGVVQTFGSLRARIDLNQQQIARETLARTLCVLPTHFGHGLIGNCLTPLLAGGDLFLAPGGGMARAAGLGAILSDHEISFMSSVPSFWKMVLKLSKPPTTKSLQQVSVGSAPVAAELIYEIAKWSGAPDVRNMYGITETANWIAGSSTQDRAPEDGLIGTMWGGKAAVRLEDGTLATEGEGEIAVKTPSLMSGYFKRPDLTKQVLSKGWYFTGDTGTIDDHGIIRLGGRIKNEINRGGMKVSPEEIDLLLERHDDVEEACAFGIPDAAAGETVAVAVKLSAGSSMIAESLRVWCTERIRRDCVPERWYFLAEIPKTDRGKLNRDIVRDKCTEGTGND